MLSISLSFVRSFYDRQALYGAQPRHGPSVRSFRFSCAAEALENGPHQQPTCNGYGQHREQLGF